MTRDKREKFSQSRREHAAKPRPFSFEERRKKKRSEKSEVKANMLEPEGSEGAVGGTGPPISWATSGQSTEIRHPNGNHGSEARREQETFQYTCGDTAPYRVYVELRKNTTERNTKINNFSLGATLRKLDGFRGHIIDMKYLGRFKIMVLVNNFIKANTLVEMINASEGDYRAYIPSHSVTISGIIAGVPADITEEEVQLGLDSEWPVVRVRRLHRRENNVQIPLNRMSVTFRSSKLPEKVRLFSCITRILPFIRKVELCEKCLRYDHRILNCKGVERCKNCGDRYEETNHYDACENPVKCASC